MLSPPPAPCPPITPPHPTPSSPPQIIRLRAKLAGVGGAVKSFFTGAQQQEDPAVAAMNNIRVRAPGSGV